MTNPGAGLSAEQLKEGLTEALRARAEWPAGLSCSVSYLPPEEVPQVEIRPMEGTDPLPPSRSIGFRLDFTLHRTTREDAEKTMSQVRGAVPDALSDDRTLRWEGMFEGVGEESELERDRQREDVFSWSIPVYLEVDGA